MSEFCAALYDVTGIQDYVFSSPKLKENVGASSLVDLVFSEWLPEAVREAAAGDCILDWAAPGEVVELLPEGCLARIAYVGGGNALVICRDLEGVALPVTRLLSEKVLERTAGGLSFAVAYERFGEGSGEFAPVLARLAEGLDRNKRARAASHPLAGLSITRSGARDGFPAVRSENGEYLSARAWKKIELGSARFDPEGGDASPGGRPGFARLIPPGSLLSFPGELDDLNRLEGESQVAVVHIDGNDMGGLVNRFLQRTSTAVEAVACLRLVSADIRRVYETAFRETAALAEQALTRGEVKTRISPAEGCLPLAPVVVSGDDVTFVCAGRLGLSLAARFLERISAGKVVFAGAGESLSACAGVAIVGHHYPFYRAYRLAEELCSSAKTKGKIASALSSLPMGGWMDFHIVYTGVAGELSDIRAGMYGVPGMRPPDPLEDSATGRKYACYNLLNRPYCVAGTASREDSWPEAEACFRQIKAWPRSRLKRLREKLSVSADAAARLLNEFRSRDFALPEFGGSAGLFRDRRTPYFDLLEMLDFYIELPGAALPEAAPEGGSPL